MYNVLLLNDGRSSDTRPLIEELRQNAEISLTVAKSLRDLEDSFLKGHLIHLLFLVIQQEPSDPLFDLISRNRNMIRLRDTHFVSLHSQASATGIQKALMLGVKTIFLEPVQKKQITGTLFNLLENNRSYKVIPSTVGENSQNLSILPCRITAFGRIGKIFQHPVGDVQIETDLNLRSGETIELRSKLAEDHGHPAFHYTVSSTSDQDTYYHYRNSYHLSWKADASLKEKLESWISRNNSFFAIPKTKILWVTDTPQDSLEAIFNKTLFSLHTQTPGRLTEPYLSRLNPRIIITGDIPEVSKKIIHEWFHNSTNHERLFIQTTPKALLPWHFIPNETSAQFKDGFLKLVKPYLLKRVSSSVKQAKYLSRSSNYSRCAITFEGNIIPLSQSHMALDVKGGIEENTILFVQCSSLEDPRKFGLYLKVLKAEPSHESSIVRQICEVIPVSDEPNPSLTHFLPRPSSKKDESPNTSVPEWERPAQTPGESVPAPRSEDLYFLKARPSTLSTKQVIATLLILGGISVILYRWAPKPQERPREPEPEGITQMEQALRAIRNAFR